MLRLNIGPCAFRRPDQQSLVGHLIDQSQQSGLSFGQDRTRAMVAPIFGSPLADLSSLLFGNGVKAILALFAASQNVGGVELTGGTTAVGFAAFAAEQVERALHHRMGALEAAQSMGQGGVGTPELLPQAGKFVAQSASLILYTIQTASVKMNKRQEIRSGSIAFEKPAPFTSFYAPFPHCLNRSHGLGVLGNGERSSGGLRSVEIDDSVRP